MKDTMNICPMNGKESFYIGYKCNYSSSKKVWRGEVLHNKLSFNSKCFWIFLKPMILRVQKRMIFTITNPSFNPSRPNNFLTMEVFNELSHFGNLLHMDVIEIFHFNCMKIKIALSNIHRINFGKFWPLDF